jgi:hypothetical protein
MSSDNNNASNNNNGAELAAATIGCRIKFSWLGATRSLDDSQSERTAALFSADADFIKASKKLFDNNRAEYKAVNRVKNSIRQYWQNNTLPFTEPGVRLLRRSMVAEFSQRLEGFAAELAAAVNELDNVYSELLNEAERRLGSLYNPADYPATLRGAFSVAFDFPNLAPPDYLAQLSPELFERERRRAAAQFSEAVELAEQSFSAELLAMVERITSTLSGDNDGKPRIFRDSMLENVSEFFQRFRTLSIGNSAELAAVVERAELALRGVTPAALRSSTLVRDMVRDRIGAVQTELEAAMVERPTRRIKIGSANAEPTPAANAEPATVDVEPVAVVSADVAAAFGLQQSPAVRIVEPVEPVAELANVEPPAADPTPSVPAGWDSVGTSTDENEPTPAVDVEPATVAAEPVEPPADPTPSVDAEPATVAYNLNYGGGFMRRLVLPNRQAAGVQ